MLVVIVRAVIGHHGRLPGRVIPEVQGIAAAGHVADGRSRPVIPGCRRPVDLLRPQPGIAVLELQRRRAVAHLLELPSGFPGVGPAVVTGGVANGVGRDGAAVE